jgi:hypothetical protein
VSGRDPTAPAAVMSARESIMPASIEPASIAAMHRRDALKVGVLVAGGVLIGTSGLLASCARGGDGKSAAPLTISSDDQALMEEIADTLLPTTPSSPGAMAAGVGPAIALLLTDCYIQADQQRVVTGLVAVRDACRAQCGGGFTKLSPAEREKFIRALDAEAVKAGKTHWFHLMRELSLRAYFSSETGMTKALRYVRVPGHFTGCVPLEKGQPAWG